MKKMAFTFCVFLAGAQELPFNLAILKGPPPEISWPSRTNFNYQLQFSASLQLPVWQALGSNQPGTGAMIAIKDFDAGRAARYYRAVETTALPSAQISGNAIEPRPGIVYPERTIIGSSALGLQYAIPSAWKGGVRDGTSSMLFGSDTDAGLVIGFITLAGDPAFISRMLANNFTTTDGTFRITRPPSTSGNRITVEWTVPEQGVNLQLVAVTHPSGGALAYAGFFTEPNRATMQRVLNDFAQSTVTVPRQTRTDLVQLISGKAFSWAKSSSTGNGGTSGSLARWSQNNAFFCPGTYEITTFSESSYSGSLSGGAFYGGGSSSTSTEAGDWTIIETQFGPVLVMMSSTGVQSAVISISGNTVRFGDQEFNYAGPHQCVTQ